MGRRWSWTGGLALASLLVAAAARAECTKDLDCSGEQICEESRCVEASPSAAPATAPVAPPAATAPPRNVSPARVIQVDTPSPAPGLRYEQRSTTAVVLGSLAIAGGAAGLLVGLGSMGSTCHYELADSFSQEHCEISPNYLAYAVGSGALVGGLILVVVGAKRVPVTPVARVSPWVSPQAAGLSLHVRL